MWRLLPNWRLLGQKRLGSLLGGMIVSGLFLGFLALGIGDEHATLPTTLFWVAIAYACLLYWLPPVRPVDTPRLDHDTDAKAVTRDQLKSKGLVRER